jgi:dipeptidyl aminopeptidase/acylaminoacyl peptidase
MKKYVYLLLILTAAFASRAQESITYQRPPDDIAKLIEAPLTPAVVTSHDNAWMIMLERSDFPTIEELSRPELRIAGLRINPENFGPSRPNYFIGIKAKKIADNKEYEIKNLPSKPLLSNVSFSPDNKRIAFLQNNANQIELWVIDLTTLTASKISDRKVNLTLGSYSWVSNTQDILFTAVPPNVAKVPEKSRVPVGPVIEENLGRKAPNRTYQDLLKNPHDESLFDYYATTELILKSATGTEKVLATGIFTTASASPDGKMILTKTLRRPYSYIVPFNRFPQSVKIIDLNGDVVKEVIDIPLTDNIPNGFNAVQTGPRSHSWRADQPSTLFWVEAQDGGDPKTKVDIRDKAYELPAPFTATATELVSLPLRYAGITWGTDRMAWVYEFWWTDRKERVYQIDPTTKLKKVIVERSSEDVYSDPGNVMTTPNQYGRYVMMVTKDNQVFLTGDGASTEGDMPFLDRMDLTTGKKTRLWRCEAPYYEYVVDLIDPKKGTFITARESQTENSNFFLRTAGSTKTTQLTAFPHPYPQLKDVKKQVLKYKRADGVDLTADLYLPPGYKKEDGALPTFFWAYPEEFKSKANAGQVKGSSYTFTRIGSGTPLFWVTRGYAILNNATVPIVGEGNEEPNDTYIQQLVASAKAAIDYAASIGVTDPNRVAAGGHSYGAFMTGNLLAHSDLFKAGIARSGAYNRTLTPFGFQSEERTYWEAPKVYFDMSPFSFADKIKEPILFIHGEADNNSGTFPVQTERFYNAIKGHGGTARFVLLPYESHGYRGKESILHMLWEMDRWLEKYVKQAGDTKVSGSE